MSADLESPTTPAGTDALGSDLLWHALIEVAREMNQALMRSAFSPVVRDVLDCTTALHMRSGDGWEMVASWEGATLHAFTSQHICNFAMAEWDLDTVQDGDVIFVNDPWRGSVHASDVNLLRPVRVDGEVKFVLHSTSHLVDLGGPIPGGFSNGAQTSFEEQLKFPPTLLYAADVPVRPVFNFLLENVRVPAAVLGDLRALHGCLAVGERRLRELFERHGADAVSAAGRHAIAVTEASMRAGIARIPDGDYAAEDFLDDDGVTTDPVPIRVTLKVRGDSVEVDYSGTGRQPAGNVGTAWAESTRCIDALKMAVDPHTPVNSGTLRPVEAIMPPGSAVCVLPPSSCSNHVDIGSRVVNLMEQNLSAALAETAIACDSGTAAMMTLGGIDTRPGHEGTPWATFALAGGGWGATWQQDGLTFCVPPLGNCRTSVQEHVELETPLMVAQHEIMPDSAGAGEHRGGFGAVYTVTTASDTMVTITADRVRRGAAGVQGGGRGMPVYGWYIRDFDLATHVDALQLRDCESLFGMYDDEGRPDPDGGTYCAGTRYQSGKVSQVLLRAGDALRIVLGGGGGWGDPLSRDVSKVVADVEDGLYTPEYATRAFGVVFTGERADEAATSARREELGRERDAGRWQVPSACPPHWRGLTADRTDEGEL